MASGAIPLAAALTIAGAVLSVSGIAANQFGWRLDLSHFGGGLFSPAGSNDSIIDNLKTQFATAEAQASPIILDLDGNGIDTVGLSEGVHFDHDGNGFAQLTGWVGGQDGLLVWDRNGNGTIDTGNELFGDSTVMLNGLQAVNGFAALAGHDSNGDGVIDANDAIWSELRIWRDTVRDGVTGEGELVTLDELGIASINVAYANSSHVDANGNAHKQVGSFTWADGATGAAVDVWFSTDNARTRATESLEVPQDIALLPDLQGFGNVHSLHQAMVRDESGQLKELVEQFSLESNPEVRRQLMADILYVWAGAADVLEISRGGNIDARKLVALEQFLGQRYSQSGWGANPGPHAARHLDEAFFALHAEMYSALMMAGPVGELLKQVEIVVDDGGIRISLAAVAAELNGLFLSADTDDIDRVHQLALWSSKVDAVNGDVWAEFIQHLGGESTPMGRVALYPDRKILYGIEGVPVNGSLGHELLFGSGGSDTMSGGGGDDFLFGGAGDDRLDGGGGRNELYGGAGDDVLWVHYAATDNVLAGGTGNDELYGSYNSDTYLFNLGDGADVIVERGHYSGALDVLRFGEGINPSDIRLERNGLDLAFVHANGEDRVTVRGLFASLASGGGINSAAVIERFEFADGTVWTWGQLRADGLEIFAASDEGVELNGHTGNDILHGGAGDDRLDGGGGRNELYGGAGDDVLWVHYAATDNVLAGGTGNDELYGSYNSDTYLFNLGDGADVIVERGHYSGALDVLRFGEGIEADQLWFERDANHLQVSVIGTEDRIVVRDWYLSGSYRVEEFRTADGALLLHGQVAAMVSAMAAFAPPGAGETSLPANYRDALDPVLAANWQ